MTEDWTEEDFKQAEEETAYILDQAHRQKRDEDRQSQLLPRLTISEENLEQSEQVETAVAVIIQGIKENDL